MVHTRNILPATAHRIAANTNAEINKMIRDTTLEILANQKDDEAELSRRIQGLNAEWDMERFVETKASICIMLFSLFGMKKHKFWCFLSLLGGTFLLSHALLGWCPTDTCMRRLGVRTADEIHQEKTVLKMMRKDFDNVKAGDAESLLEAAEK